MNDSVTGDFAMAKPSKYGRKNRESQHIHLIDLVGLFAYSASSIPSFLFNSEACEALSFDRVRPAGEILRPLSCCFVGLHHLPLLSLRNARFLQERKGKSSPREFVSEL